MDGLECCKRIRSNPLTKTIPIILLSVHNSEVYKITALESGADDFVTKPFSHGELLARVKAILRRAGKGESPKSQGIKDKLFTLDRTSRTIHLRKRKLPLSPKEFTILELFLRMPGQVVSRDLLAAQVWEQENLQTSRTIDVHLARLRKKLGRYQKVIQTVGKVGYRYEPMDT
jgi:DNA-binding response OmpR family regulator